MTKWKNHNTRSYLDLRTCIWMILGEMGCEIMFIKADGEDPDDKAAITCVYMLPLIILDRHKKIPLVSCLSV